MNIQELPIENNQSNGVSVWQVHDYANSLINDVMGMQYNQDTPANAEDLLERLQGAQHPMDIGKLIQVLKELESEIKILSDQTYQTRQAIHAWNVPEYGDTKRVYDVTYTLNLAGNPDGLTTVEPVKNSYDNQYKYITYDSVSSDYPSGYGYDS